MTTRTIRRNVNRASPESDCCKQPGEWGSYLSVRRFSAVRTPRGVDTAVKLSGRFPIPSVRSALALDGLLTAGLCWPPEVTDAVRSAARQQWPVRGGLTTTLYLARMPGKRSLTEVVATLRRRNLRPASASELVAFAAQYRNQVSRTVVAAGTVWHHRSCEYSDDSSVVCLTQSTPNRATALVLRDFHWHWWDTCDCYYLVAPADPKPAPLRPAAMSSNLQQLAMRCAGLAR